MMDISEYLFASKEGQHKLYNALQQMDMHRNYGIQHTNADYILAEHIHNNYDHMSLEEMKHVVLKCLTEKDIRHILLKYELKYIQRKPSCVSLEQFKKIAIKYLHRYQSKAGGFRIGDCDWTIHDTTSRKYTINANEIVFENTINDNELHTRETVEYLEGILRLLNSISSQVVVTLHTKFYDRDKIQLLMLKCKEIKKN